MKLNENQVINKSEEWLKEKINEYDLEKWTKEMASKSSLELYRESKKEIKECSYKNDEASIFSFKLKTNTVNLGDRKRFKKEDTSCRLCEEPNEDLQHFVTTCIALQEERQKILNLQLPQEENKKELTRKVIFEQENHKELLQMFQLRNKKLKILEEV